MYRASVEHRPKWPISSVNKVIIESTLMPTKMVLHPISETGIVPEYIAWEELAIRVLEECGKRHILPIYLDLNPHSLPFAQGIGHHLNPLVATVVDHLVGKRWSCAQIKVTEYDRQGFQKVGLPRAVASYQDCRICLAIKVDGEVLKVLEAWKPQRYQPHDGPRRRATSASFGLTSTTLP